MSGRDAPSLPWTPLTESPIPTSRLAARPPLAPRFTSLTVGYTRHADIVQGSFYGRGRQRHGYRKAEGGGEVGVNTKACWDCWDTMCSVDLLVQSLSNRWQGSDQMFAVELVVRLSWSLEPQVSVSPVSMGFIPGVVLSLARAA